MAKILKFFSIALSTILFTVLIGMFTIFNFFLEGFPEEIHKYGWQGIIIIFLLAIIIAIISTVVWIWITLIKPGKLVFKDDESVRIATNPQFFDTLKVDLQKQLDNNNYSDVIRIGASLSRALWISGEYKNRVDIGSLVYEAAVHVQNESVKAKILIDDIGWTYLFINNKSSAIHNINEGIALAQRQYEWYLVAKGYRHLFNISLKLNDIVNAQSYLKEAEAYTDKILNASDKNEMKNGIDYDKIELLIQEKNLSKAKIEGLRILQEYKQRRDFERIPKLYSILGKIAFINNNYLDAIDNFLNGLSTAEKYKRKDEIIKNSMGLAVSYFKDGNIDRAKVYKDQCDSELMGNKTILMFWNLIKDEFEKINF